MRSWRGTRRKSVPRNGQVSRNGVDELDELWEELPATRRMRNRLVRREARVRPRMPMHSASLESVTVPFLQRESKKAGRRRMHAEVCPVCAGRGRVAPGFYGARFQGTTGALENVCRSCGGAGYVFVPDDESVRRSIGPSEEKESEANDL